ncbi:hypothetical protein B0T21DRAFT_348405 [Apiosordaria backusii]|uniref:Uncharacterized protein n=1 Tax=Apiosordaria backusii TaxID=314023 RepID=A0AA40BLH4_9PEZI|nr:hypothetical protein B0T21DRAFT_348405 [Apiosordaria backusii]
MYAVHRASRPCHAVSKATVTTHAIVVNITLILLGGRRPAGLVKVWDVWGFPEIKSSSGVPGRAIPRNGSSVTPADELSKLSHMGEQAAGGCSWSVIAPIQRRKFHLGCLSACSIAYLKEQYAQQTGCKLGLSGLYYLPTYIPPFYLTIFGLYFRDLKKSPVKSLSLRLGL